MFMYIFTAPRLRSKVRFVCVFTGFVLRILKVLCLGSTSGPGCSKLTTSLVNVSLKFQMLIS